MKKKILKKILHILHFIYESLQKIGIAMAKSIGIKEKYLSTHHQKEIDKTINILKIRRIVFTTMVIASIVIISINTTTVTSQDDNFTSQETNINHNTSPESNITSQGTNSTHNVTVTNQDYPSIPGIPMY